LWATSCSTDHPAILHHLNSGVQVRWRNFQFKELKPGESVTPTD